MQANCQPVTLRISPDYHIGSNCFKRAPLPRLGYVAIAYLTVLVNLCERWPHHKIVAEDKDDEIATLRRMFAGVGETHKAPSRLKAVLNFLVGGPDAA